MPVKFARRHTLEERWSYVQRPLSSASVAKGNDGLIRPIHDYASFLRGDENVKELIRLNKKEVAESPRFTQTKLLAKRSKSVPGSPTPGSKGQPGSPTPGAKGRPRSSSSSPQRATDSLQAVVDAAANSVAELGQRTKEWEAEKKRKLRLIENHLVLQHQEERSLARLEDETRRRQRALHRVLREMESSSEKRNSERERELRSTEEAIEGARQKANHERRSLSQNNGDHKRAVTQVAKDRLRKALLNETDLSRRYRGKEEEMQMKRIEVERLVEDFEAKLRKKETERMRLQKELGELAIALCSEVLKKRQQEDAVSATFKDDEVHRARESAQVRSKLESETEAFGKKAEKIERAKRKLEKEAKTLQDTLTSREREHDLDKRDIRQKADDNQKQRRKIREEELETKVRFKEVALETEIELHSKRRLKSRTSELAGRRKERDAKEARALEDFKRRDLHAKFREHDDHVNHVMRAVEKGETVEKELTAAVKEVERVCRKEEQELNKMGALLQDVHKQNSQHLNNEMIKCSQEEEELEVHYQQMRAELKQAQTQREELLLGLKRQQERVRAERDKLTQLEKEQARLLKLGSRPAEEVQKVPKPYIQHYPAGLP